MLVLENVPGMNVAHAGESKDEGTYFEKLIGALQGLGYKADGRVLDAARFGVPQRRARIVVVGVREKDTGRPLEVVDDIFQAAMNEGARQLKEYSDGSFVSAREAISDLIVGNGLSKLRKTEEYVDDSAHARGAFRQLRYIAPQTTYQRRMNKGVPAARMDSMRLANHSVAVEERFQKILSNCPRGVNISADNREWLGMLKHRTIPMDEKGPSPTLTTLPDDVLHYRDPRILTVREYARIQSFPDWFKFRGKYTTGGQLRKLECPRYTQVGNAVPPLLGRAVGVALRKAFTANVKSDHGVHPGCGHIRWTEAESLNVHKGGDVPVLVELVKATG
jgi:DNA (cytosine-5)-methyltransferase 1